MMTSGTHVGRVAGMNCEGFVGIRWFQKDTFFAQASFRRPLRSATRTPGFPIARIALVRGQGLPVDKHPSKRIPGLSEQNRIIGEMSYLRSENWIIFIPHWLLILAVAGTWAGVMAWRRRRIEKGLKGSSMGG